MSVSGASDKERTEEPRGFRDRVVPRGAGMLRKGAEFDAVLRSGCRLVSPNFVLRAIENPLGYPRLGIIAGKKSAPRAVDRNRARRLVREAFRLFAPALGTHDVTIQLRGDLRDAPNSAARGELHKLFEGFVRRATTTTERQSHRG